MPNLQVNKKLEKVFNATQPIIVIIGGRGSGKSIGIGDILTFKMATEKADMYCLREFQDSVTDSVHRVFKDSIQKRLKLEGWTIQENCVISPEGATTKYKGANRNPDSIQSSQGYKYSWFEEAHRASQDSIDKLLPTILRNPGAKCIFTANPQSSADPFSQRFITPYLSELEANGIYEDDMHLIIVVNWRDNPWWNEEQESLRQWDYDNLTRSKYDWMWEGKFNDTIEDAIIQPEWFDAAIDAHLALNIKPTGAVVTTFDPADMGGDSKGYASRKGILYTDVDEIVAKDGNVACDIATDRAIEANSDLFVWDGDGMGALLRKQIGESFAGIKCELRMYKGSNAVEDKKAIWDNLKSFSSKDRPKTNEDMLKNKRTQYYMKLAKRFENTYRAVVKKEYIDPDSIISISSDIKMLQKLRAEVCRIPRKPNGTGKIQLMSKEEMKAKLKIDSPGMADCLAMGEEVPDLIKDTKPIEFESLW
jgi:phage terminase large subunit